MSSEKLNPLKELKQTYTAEEFLAALNEKLKDCGVVVTMAQYPPKTTQTNYTVKFVGNIKHA